MKKCNFCGTIKDLKLFSYDDDTKEEFYVCVDCLHKEVRKAYLQAVKESEEEE